MRANSFFHPKIIEKVCLFGDWIAAKAINLGAHIVLPSKDAFHVTRSCSCLIVNFLLEIKYKRAAESAEQPFLRRALLNQKGVVRFRRARGRVFCRERESDMPSN